MTYLIKPDTSTARRYVTWLITCLLRVCSALYCELSVGLSCQVVSSGVAGCSCLPDGPSSTPSLLCLHEVRLVRAASWQKPSSTVYQESWQALRYRVCQCIWAVLGGCGLCQWLYETLDWLCTRQCSLQQTCQAGWRLEIKLILTKITWGHVIHVVCCWTIYVFSEFHGVQDSACVIQSA